MFFEKKVTIFKKKDKETWSQIKDALKEAGIDANASHYFADTVAAGGCGSKLDPRNFGAKVTIDRDIYVIKVKEADQEAALSAIRAKGLVTVVDEQAAVDAALKRPLV